MQQVVHPNTKTYQMLKVEKNYSVSVPIVLASKSSGKVLHFPDCQVAVKLFVKVAR